MNARYYAVDPDSLVVNEAEASMGKPIEVMVDLEYGLTRMQLLNALVGITDHISRNQPAPSPASVAGPPVNRDVPYASGTGAVGSTLNCTMGNWYGEPSSYAYRWLSDGSPALNGESANYVVVTGDQGHTFTCVVTATNANGSTAAPPSNPVVVP
jgi:hypothetical protein